MPTTLHVTSAAIVVTCCLAISYALFLAAETISRVNDLALAQGLMNAM